MNPALGLLRPYPFEQLEQLRQSARYQGDKYPIDLSIGEPKHPTPELILHTLVENLSGFSQYPATRGLDKLRESIGAWLIKRFHLPDSSVDANRHVLPVCGTREALFAIAQCVVDNRARQPRVVFPNPFYQIYEGAAFLAGARPYYINCLSAHGFQPRLAEVPEAVWENCQLVYVCSPSNPTGSVIPPQTLTELLCLADQYDFVIAADECYSEIYLDEHSPPRGLLEVAASQGRTGYDRCLVFHSLSKRSNVPGLRSGFVAGDARLIERFLHYRTYQGCAMPIPVQRASIAAWSDEQHVVENRARYREKFQAVLEILSPVLNITQPEAAFYLWPALPLNGVEFTERLLARENVVVLPGRFLAREVDGTNPGDDYARIALVAPLNECIVAAERIRDFIQTL